MNDLIIIGAGPGGYELAIKASKSNLKTILIEKEKLGGVCLNSGCIPTKTYYYASSLIGEIKKSQNYGISSTISFDFLKLNQRKEEVVSDLVKGIDFCLNKAGVEIIYGMAKLISNDSVLVNGTVYQAKNIVIATGSHNYTIKNFEDFLTSTDILDLKTLPNSLAIIGGGVIGIEMASIFNRFGVEVTVIEAKDTILNNYDKDISNRLLSFLKAEGIKFYLNCVCKKVDNKLVINKNNEDIIIEAEKILVCVGRRPNVFNLGLEDVGIKFNEYGISVDDDFKTNIDNIYAIGDVIGKNMLAHYATYSGYHVLNKILGLESNIDFKNVPSCTFTYPEVSSVGCTEYELNQREVKYKVFKNLYKTNGKSSSMDKTDGYVKIIVVDDIIVGGAIIGYDASTLIHELAVLISKKISINDIKTIIHAHPTLSEIISNLINDI